MGKSKEDAIELIRKLLVASMKAGEFFILFTSSTVIDFKNTMCDEKNLPTELIFDFKEWRKETNYMKIVREEETRDMYGNKGCFIMNEEFSLCILANYEEGIIDKVKENIPKIENFDIYIVE